MRLVRLSHLIVLAGALSSCEGLFDPADERVSDSDLTFVRVAPDAPPLSDTVVSFYIKRGEEREVRITYTYLNGDGKCLLLRVPADAPLRKPDGSAFAVGDSLEVTVRVVDASRFQFQFEPAGLQFDPRRPAELEVRYRWADPDYNGDGVVDAEDAALEASFSFWRQEQPGAGWEKITTLRVHDALEAHARIPGFTQYALASE